MVDTGQHEGFVILLSAPTRLDDRVLSFPLENKRCKGGQSQQRLQHILDGLADDISPVLQQELALGNVPNMVRVLGIGYSRSSILKVLFV